MIVREAQATELAEVGELRVTAYDSDHLLKAQGRGVGRTLVRAVLERTKARQAERLVLLTQPRMVAAHRLYEQAGFVRAPDRDIERAPGFWLLAYQKSL